MADSMATYTLNASTPAAFTASIILALLRMFTSTGK